MHVNNFCPDIVSGQMFSYSDLGLIVQCPNVISRPVYIYVWYQCIYRIAGYFHLVYIFAVRLKR